MQGTCRYAGEGRDSFEQLAELHPVMVEAIEVAKRIFGSGHAAASIASAIFSAVIKVGKLVSAQGTTGNSDASTTRRPPTPRTLPWVSVTAIGSSSDPMRHVQLACLTPVVVLRIKSSSASSSRISSSRR